MVGLFAMSEETEALCVLGAKIIAVGFLFAGGNIAVQAVFQALGSGFSFYTGGTPEDTEDVV